MARRPDEVEFRLHVEWRRGGPRNAAWRQLWARIREEVIYPELAKIADERRGGDEKCDGGGDDP